MIHTSDSIGRFYPIGPKNERYEAGLWRQPGDTQATSTRAAHRTRSSRRRARTCTASIRRRASSTRTWRCCTTTRKSSRRSSTRIRTPTSKSRRPFRISGARRGSGVSSSSSIRTACSSAPTAVPRAGRRLLAPHWRTSRPGRVFPSPRADSPRGRLAGSRPLAHLGHRSARRRAAQGLLRERPAPPAGASGVDPAAARRAALTDWAARRTVLLGRAAKPSPGTRHPARPARGSTGRASSCFHLDEYIGLAAAHPASFRKYHARASHRPRPHRDLSCGVNYCLNTHKNVTMHTMRVRLRC